MDTAAGVILHEFRQFEFKPVGIFLPLVGEQGDFCRPLLRYADLHVPAGARLCVMAPSGAGKTTLLRMIAGIGPSTSGRILMDGRDIGTVVLPNATVKIYLTASAEARAQRRWLELHEKGDPIPLEQVLEDVQQRDYNDTHRDVAPLRQAEDAVLVDTTECDLEESYQLLLKTIRERI